MRKPRLPTLLRLCAATLACATLAACNNFSRVEAWEKGNLAKPSMRMEGDALDARFTAHVYTS